MVARAVEKRRPDLRGPALDRPIEEKVAWADERFRGYGDRLRQDPVLAGLLGRFETAAAFSRRRMRETGVEAFCRDCERLEGGSCCGKGIEDRYSAVLLLINRLLNRPLPRARWDSAGCFFLGPKGCVLAARHVICINYLCGRITRSLSPTTLEPLRTCEGAEIQTLFLLEERVKQVLYAEGP